MSSKWSNISAAIYGCAGESLNAEEKSLFKAVRPYGFILFARNCKNPEQIKRLVGEMKESCGHENPAILIDQEGGRVMRLTPPLWRNVPAAGKFAALYESGKHDEAKRAVYVNASLIAHDLSELGINVDCAPMLDVRALDSHNIIGDRAFGSNPEQVALLGKAMAYGLEAGGVMPVIKHIPGHGRAVADSHIELPVVDASIAELEKTDFAPFRELRNAPYAMTAHVLYTALDNENVATFSASIIKIIREKIGFDGLLMSDDFSMKALTGSFADRTRKAFDAGCDLALHCNGDFSEMKEIADNTPSISASAAFKAEKIVAMYKNISGFDVAAATAELDLLLQTANV